MVCRPRLLRGCYSGSTPTASRPIALLVLLVFMVQCPMLSFAYTTPVGVPTTTSASTSAAAAAARSLTTTRGKTIMTNKAQQGGTFRLSTSHPFPTGRSTTTIRSMIEPSSSSSITDNNNNSNRNGDGDSNDGVWYPLLRQFIGSIATVGAIDTAYLTYSKLQTSSSNGDGGILCGINGDCNNVLNGPYSTLPYTDIPLAALGFVAYAAVIALALGPLVLQQQQQQQPQSSEQSQSPDTNAATATASSASDSTNRQALAGLTSLMGSFSICLMILLYGVLHLSCPYCVLSAGCSTLLAALTVIGKCWPETDGSNNNSNNNNNVERNWSLATVTGGSALTATAVAVLLYVGGSGSPFSSLESAQSTTTDLMATMTMAPSPATAVADLQQQQGGKAPPPITTDSSTRAIRLTNDLVALNAKMYGAYWCSHCFDQKMELGRQAFTKGNIPYIECSKDGLNAQVQLCASKKLPGYPTWEINGEFFPGQQELDELEQIVLQEQQQQQTLKTK